MNPAKKYFTVYGQSWAGNLVRRNGQTISCGHKHRTSEVRGEPLRIESLEATMKNVVFDNKHIQLRKP